MTWSEVSILTKNEAVEPISNILHEAGASGIVIEDPEELTKARTVDLGEMYDLNPEDYPEDGVLVKAYLQKNNYLSETVEKIKQSIDNLSHFHIDTGSNQLTMKEVHEEDWATAWKKYYKPVNISEKITITPTWESYTPDSEEEIIIELDPGMAFGTGTHPTTILSLQAIEKYIQAEDTVLDIGSGSGVLSIGAVLLGAAHVYAYDLDDIAVKSTGENAKVNKVENRITTRQNNLMDNVEVEAELIVSNILAEIIVRFTEKAYHQLKPGGLFITSGIIQEKKELVKKEMEKNGFQLVEENQLEDWISLVYRKPV